MKPEEFFTGSLASQYQKGLCLAGLYERGQPCLAPCAPERCFCEKHLPGHLIRKCGRDVNETQVSP